MFAAITGVSASFSEILWPGLVSPCNSAVNTQAASGEQVVRIDSKTESITAVVNNTTLIRV